MTASILLGFLGGLGTGEIILIALVVLLLFGGRKIPELMKGIGKGVKSFKDGMQGLEEETKEKVAALIIQDLLRDEIIFETPLCRQIFVEMAELLQKEIIADKDYFLHHSNQTIATLAIDLTILPYELSHNWEKNQIYISPESDRLMECINNALLGFKAKKIERMITENDRKLRKDQGSIGDSEITEILNQRKKYLEIRQRIQNKELGRTIIK